VPTAEREQRAALLCIVDPRGNGRQAQCRRCADPGSTHLQRHLIAAQGRHPCTVELQAPDGRSRQAVHRDHSAPYLIDDEPHSKGDQGLAHRGIERGESALRYAQLQPVRRNGTFLQKTLDVTYEIVMQNMMPQSAER